MPSQAAIDSAGAPPGSSPLGQQVPLFACMEIMREDEAGKPALPLFFVYDEAKEAMGAALALDGPQDGDEYKIVGLSLQRAVQLLATVPETPAFQFVTPAASATYIRNYLGK